jgi:hypothetical protein
MGYRSNDELADLFPERFVEDTSREITDRVGDRLRDGVAMRTPVARLPAAYKGDFEDWIGDRSGRPPRTMRDSWVRTEVARVGDDILRVEVYSDEPLDEHGWQKVAYVEDDTKPHLIRAHLREGGRQGSLRFPMGANFMLRVQVHHPGTQGVHMLRNSLAEMEVMWIEIGEEVLEAKAAEYNAG